MNPLDLIRFHKNEFTQSELVIMEFMLNNPDKILKMGLVDLAQQIKVSKSGLLRFVQKLGYHGYPEFKYEISRYLQSGTSHNYDEFSYSTIINVYTKTIQKLNQSLDFKKIEEFSELIINSKKVKIFGSHESGLSASMLSFRLTTIGIDSHVITDETQFINQAQFCNSDDLNIFFSISGTNIPIINTIESSMQLSCKCVLITQNTLNKFRKKINHIFYIPSFDVSTADYFYDSQALNFIVIEIIINAVSKKLNEKSKNLL